MIFPVYKWTFSNRLPSTSWLSSGLVVCSKYSIEFDNFSKSRWRSSLMRTMPTLRPASLHKVSNLFNSITRNRSTWRRALAVSKFETDGGRTGSEPWSIVRGFQAESKVEARRSSREKWYKSLSSICFSVKLNPDLAVEIGSMPIRIFLDSKEIPLET